MSWGVHIPYWFGLSPRVRYAGPLMARPSHGQRCSRAHRNTSRCQTLVAAAHISSSHRPPRSYAHLNTVPFLGGGCTRSRVAASDRVPRAVVLPRPPQHLNVPAPVPQTLSGQPATDCPLSETANRKSDFHTNETKQRHLIRHTQKVGGVASTTPDERPPG